MKDDLSSQLAKALNMTVPHGKQKRSFPRMQKTNLKVGVIVFAPLASEEGLVLSAKYKSRDKFFVIVGISSDGFLEGSLLINTKKNYGNALMMTAQKHLSSADYPFLDYDSWLDCSQLFRIPTSLVLKNGGYCGELTNKDWKEVHAELVASPFIDEDTKAEFGIS